MQKANPVRRGVLGRKVAFAAGAGLHSPGRRVWFAVCPECGDRVMHPGGYPHYARPTRKNTKDALYRHRQQQHEPGLVGRG